MKRIAKDATYLRTAFMNDRSSMSAGRKIQSGVLFICEIYCPDCESRGYCNGDC
jgi:hypothetical protein